MTAQPSAQETTGEHLRRRCGAVGLSVVLAIVLLLSFGALVHAGERPNIVFILADDVGLGDLSGYNPNSQVALPTLHQLAADGIRFNDAHTSAAKCAPSRYSIMTGNYQWRGLRNWGQWQYKGGSQILAGQKSLGQILQDAGYTTAVLGKYHLGGDFHLKSGNGLALAQTPDDQVDFSRPMLAGPGQRGFDYSFVALRGIQGSPYAFFENDRMVGSVSDLIHWPVGDYGNTGIEHAGIGLRDWNTREVGPALMSKALQFIDDHVSGRNANKPFFLYLNTQAVHSPLKPPTSLGGRQILGSTGLSPRADLLVEVDVILEQIQAALRRHGLTEETIIIFSSDNGALRGDGELRRGHDSSMGFRGAKGRIYEAGHRVPLVIKWGARGVKGSSRPAGSAVEGLVGVQDLYATLADLVGVRLAPEQGRDSVSILPLLRGTTNRSPRDHMIHQADRTETGAATFLTAYRSGQWKLILDDRDRPIELYDLERDRAERDNLINAAQHATLIERLARDYRSARSASRTMPVGSGGGGGGGGSDGEGPDPQPPAAPSMVTASAISTSRIRLDWRDNSSNETGFRIERRLQGGGWTRIATTTAGVTTFADSGLSAGTSYGYRVQAFNAAGASVFSDEAVVVTEAAPEPEPAQVELSAAILPTARAVAVNQPATVFASLINQGQTTATGCSIALPAGVPARLAYQTTNASNALIGRANNPVDIAPGATQNFVIGITPTREIAGLDIAPVFKCRNSDAVSRLTGLNTLLLSAMRTAPPDLLAVGVTPSADGILRLPRVDGHAAFAVSAINIGSGGRITVSPDDAGRGLPLGLEVCEINVRGEVIECGASLTRWIRPAGIVFYGVFVSGQGRAVALDPGRHRLFLRFAMNETPVGATSVAVTAP
ncbi:hypothetical protein CKO25_04595 [Thiocapsa imhoffii]|uniref:Fibronectin type-III domain-containing protein n=1 Tax=Thiocapsa imhoffii TaxID=382777 RepID=A0A9X0WFY2_9GAMM|nr:sulfatase-like hydrolase/transferase [Thiocapsa imhoffii]MBK1643947.1 hypothetical protein [Thiocapsa imhoffii]